MSAIVKHRLFWPIVALLALILLNTLSRPSFVSITVQDGACTGRSSTSCATAHRSCSWRSG